MEEDPHKNRKFYQLPPAEPKPKPAPYVPVGGPAKPTGIFIENPTSLPTDLRKYEVKRNYWEQVKLIEEVPYKPPKILGMTTAIPKNKIKYRKIIAGPLLSETQEIHTMRIKAKQFDIKKQVNPVTMLRKEVLSYADLQALERAEAAAKDELAAKGGNEDGTKKDTVSNADITKIAPYGGAARNKKNMFKKRTKQIFQHDPDVRIERARESKPWVLEDGNEKEVLRGTIDGTKEGRYFILYANKKTHKMEIKPVSRCYAFTEKPSYRIPTLEECEAMQNAKTKKEKAELKKLKQGRGKNLKGNEDEEAGDAFSSRFGLKNSKSAPVSGAQFLAVRRDTGDDEEFGNQDAEDIDEIDYEENFQDDEEGAGLDMEDDETKESARRIKKSQNRFKPSAYYSDEGDDDEESDGEVAIKKSTKSKKRAGRDSDDGSDSESQEDEDSDKDLPIIGRIDGEDPLKAKIPAKFIKPSATQDKSVKPSDATSKASKQGKPSKPSKDGSKSTSAAPNKAKKAKVSEDKSTTTPAKPVTSAQVQPTPSSSNRITLERIVSVVHANPGRTNKEIFNILGLTPEFLAPLGKEEKNRIKKLFVDVTHLDNNKILSLKPQYSKHP